MLNEWRIDDSNPKAVAHLVKEQRKHNDGGDICIGLNNGKDVVGVAIVGRPVARYRDDGFTAEVTRLCVLDGYKNSCSMLYSAAWRACRAIGYKRIGTYILFEESGTSLRAAGWKIIHATKGGPWNCKSRPRVDTSPIGQKILCEIGILEKEND